MNAPSKVVVIGSRGFVGPQIVADLERRGWDVLGVSRRAEGTATGRSRVLAADVTQASSEASWLRWADAVIYNAAHLPRDYTDPAEAEACWRVNAYGVLRVLEALRGTGKRFIYISTGQGYVPKSEPAREEDAIFPAHRATYYLASKLTGELYTEHYRLNYSVPACVLRLGALYGAGQAGGMVGTFVRKARERSPLVLRDGGLFASDLTWVMDAGRAAGAALAADASGVFNIGSGRATTAIEAARIVVQAAGADDTLITVEPASAGALPGFAPLDIGRAKTHLSYVPTPVETGLVETVREWPG